MKIDQVQVFYNYFHSAGSQKPTLEEILPITNIPAKKTGQQINPILEPGRLELMEALVTQAFRLELYRMMLATSAGERSFRGVQDTDKVVLVVPEGTVDTHQQAPDFAMHYFRILPKLGDGVPVLGIYVGKRPLYLHVQEDAAAKDGGKVTVTKTKADLLGTAGAEWHRWASGGVEHSEAIVPYPGRKEWAMHVFCAGATAAEIDRLVKIAATLRVAS
jgi:hypothetical protein